MSELTYTTVGKTLTPRQKEDIINLSKDNDFYVDRVPASFDAIYTIPPLYEMVYTSEGKLIAFGVLVHLIATQGKCLVEIQFLLVDKNHRNKKIGKTLISTMLNVCRAMALFTHIIVLVQCKKTVLPYFLRQGFQLKGLSDSKTHHVCIISPTPSVLKSE